MQDLWQSTEDLFARFGLQQTPRAALAKFAEEVGEFRAEVRWGTKADVAEELVDVVVTAFAAAMARELTWDDIEAARQRVIDKNNAKTTETHEVRGGMVARRVNDG